jgi:hypothetical protein
VTAASDLTGTTIAVGTVVIAVAALVVSIWENAAARKHNRLSVRPLLRVDCLGERQGPLSVTLVNSGVGPAIVENFTAELNGESLPSSELHPVDCALKRLGVAPEEYVYFTPWPGEAISAGEKLTLLTFPKTAEDRVAAERLKSLLPKICLCISYKSIYDEKFVFNGDCWVRSTITPAAQ